MHDALQIAALWTLAGHIRRCVILTEDRLATESLCRCAAELEDRALILGEKNRLEAARENPDEEP